MGGRTQERRGGRKEEMKEEWYLRLYELSCSQFRVEMCYVQLFVTV